ncbi:hypothetical protein DM02DRAFT_695117 [Periconia macrospinosa]|uniref:Uncharacterized protein n=1 Tax=Periconia macrospinosa TaxID=97972 RepID=A0A2V1D6T5_9PLEO|nr:hypothetical protein DM02DRAFT_695117 [Periconia macrospinosa]
MASRTKNRANASELEQLRTGFVGDTTRVNLAVTRARDALYIIADDEAVFDFCGENGKSSGGYLRRAFYHMTHWCKEQNLVFKPGNDARFLNPVTESINAVHAPRDHTVLSISFANGKAKQSKAEPKGFGDVHDDGDVGDFGGVGDDVSNSVGLDDGDKGWGGGFEACEDNGGDSAKWDKGSRSKREKQGGMEVEDIATGGW